MPEEPKATTEPVEPSPPNTRIGRGVVVATAIGAAVGASLLTYYSWIQTHTAFRSMWMNQVTGDQWFNAARTSVTALGVLGLGGAAYLAYRKQQTNEVEAFRDRRSSEVERHDAIQRDLHSRYTNAAAQLGHDDAAIRLAGVYALAALADDWYRVQDSDQRQVSVNLLTAICDRHRGPQPPATKIPENWKFEIASSVS